MKDNVVVANDLTWLPVTVGFDVSHMMAAPGFEVPCNIEWAAWANSGYHELAPTVLHQNSAIAQAWHNCGRLIAHLLQPPSVILGPLQSTRTIMFSAMAVRVEGSPIGFANLILGQSMPTPMLTCGLVSLPVADAMTAPSNTVIVGMDPELDYALCWEGVVVEMAASAVIGAVNVVLTIATAGTSAIFAAIAAVIGLSATEGGIEFGAGRRWVERGRGQSGSDPSPRSNAVTADPASWPSI